MSSFLDSDITFLTGVGENRAKFLQTELGIFTFKDLLYFFPYRYIDRTKFYNISDIYGDLPYIQIKGNFLRFEQSMTTNGKKKTTAFFADNTGVIEVLWFQNPKWIIESINFKKEYILFGKPTVFNNHVNLVHPDIEDADKFDSHIANKFFPQYSLTEKIKKANFSSKTISKLMETLLPLVRGKIIETFPDYFIQQYKLIDLETALFNLHFPKNQELLNKAQDRIKFEELFYIQLGLLKAKIIRKDKSIGFIFDKSKDNFVKECFFHKIPFKLTNAQTRVLKEIRADFESGKQANRLIQGDVGSGKTMVALLSALIAIDNGFQTCIMAPTEILAQQHFRSISQFLSGINVKIELLTGSTKKKQRKIIHEQLLSGDINLLIGTHALIEDNVEFQNIGLVVIDEQHRFGVEQRAKLWRKNASAPHILVMTATPIPRTLAMTLYGDLDISVIDELPPGRTPIITKHFKENQRNYVYDFMRKQIKEGRQLYVVYPLIKESESFDYKHLEEGVEQIKEIFKSPEYEISVVHGKLKPAEKEAEMQRFMNKETQIMVATTVIEVGVDVPNASLMIIESSERFGLSQLHQLRGRVGRGANQSFCFLMTADNLTDTGYKRIMTMVQTTDGFQISEVDLQLRGPGDMEGKQQSGFVFDLKLANMSKDGNLIQFVRNIADDILQSDPDLIKAENFKFKQILYELNKGKMDLGKIS